MIRGIGRLNGNTAQLVDSFYFWTISLRIADDFFWTFEQAVSYYRLAIVNYIGLCDKGMSLAGGCGDANSKAQIDKTNYLKEVYEFGKNLYSIKKIGICVLRKGENIWISLSLKKV